jgi:hypothetical protein
MDVSVPDWRASRAGARTRVALWLFSEVGELGTFTKAQLREAFPGVEQIDRRMRDLRGEGWQISTYREDRALAVDELRLLTVGGRVWEAGYRTRQATVADTDRARALEADGYACRACGISAGELYADDQLRTAKLSVERTRGAGDSGPYLRTLCERCLSGRRRSAHDTVAETAALISAMSKVSDRCLEQFARWVGSEKRDLSESEALWSQYCALPSEARREIAHESASALRQRRASANNASQSTPEQRGD